MSGASDATTEQYFASERSTARRTFTSSAPAPRTATCNAMAVNRRGSVSRRVPCTDTSRASSLTRCFWRMITTSDAVHVAAARSSSSTGDVAAVASPSTRIAGRPTPLPSNCRLRSQRIVTSAVRVMLVAPPRRESDEEAVPAQPVHAVVLEDPVERRAVAQLETECRVEPEPRAPRIGPASVATRQAEARPDVRRRDLFIVGEPPQQFGIPDVGIGPIEHADLRRGAEPEAIREQIADVQCRAQHQLAGAADVHAPAYAEAEQSDARAPMPAVLRRLKLLRRCRMRGEYTDEREHHDSHACPRSPIQCEAPEAVLRAAVRP